MKREDSRSMVPQAILFDLDGTLLDSAHYFVTILNGFLQRYDYAPITVQALRPHISFGVVAMLRAAFGALLTKNDLDALRLEFLDDYERLLEHSAGVYFSGVEMVINTLVQQSIPYGIVTNKQQRFGERILAKAFFKESLGCVVYGDTLALSKPAPQPLWLACQRLQVEPRSTWFVGDSLADMQAADRAGCIGVVAAYGYVEPRWRHWPSVHVVHQPIDLLQILKDVRMFYE